VEYEREGREGNPERKEDRRGRSRRKPSRRKEMMTEKAGRFRKVVLY